MPEVQLMLDGVDPPLAVHVESLTALNWASHCGKPDIVSQLLEIGTKDNGSRYSSLDLAAKQGHDDVIQVLIDHGNDIDGCPFQRPLMSAIRNHQTATVKLLLNCGASVDGMDSDWTPIHQAAHSGHLDLMRILLERGANWRAVTGDRNDEDDYDQTALHLAALKVDDSKVNLILQMADQYFVHTTNSSGRTALHLAAKGPIVKDLVTLDKEQPNREATARLLLKHGARAVAIDKHGCTPLHYAAWHGRSIMIEMLLDASAVIDAQTGDGMAPLHCAAQANYPESVKSLIDRGANVNLRTMDLRTPLHLAVSKYDTHLEYTGFPILFRRAVSGWDSVAGSGIFESVKALMVAGADTLAKDNMGRTPVFDASKGGKFTYPAVRLLLEQGANMTEHEDCSGWAPLHCAAQAGYRPTAQLLIDHGGDINHQDSNGETALHVACQNGQESVAQLLVEKGVNISVANTKMELPIHKAAAGGNENIIRLLLQRGADSNAATSLASRPLHFAVENGSVLAIKTLLDYGAGLSPKACYGWTPLHVAIALQRLPAVELLLEYGADTAARSTADFWWVLQNFDEKSSYGQSSFQQMISSDPAADPPPSQDTPLHWAADIQEDWDPDDDMKEVEPCSLAFIRTLLEHGADPRARDSAGRTPLHRVCLRSGAEQSTMALLLKHGVDVNAVDNDLRTALHLASMNKATKAALHEFGAQTLLRDRKGKTAEELKPPPPPRMICGRAGDRGRGRGRG